MFNVLLLDDDKDFLKALQSYLVKEGYSADAVTCADDAYDAMYHTTYDLIISDIMMPGVDGFQFAEHVTGLIFPGADQLGFALAAGSQGNDNHHDSQ